ncbi:MAG: FecR domain-containing protein [Proteobacteria bacterium]|nr:FecR domain-containing protein [Pseudomonadota bacterium]
MARPATSRIPFLRAVLLGTAAVALFGSPAAMARVGVTSATDGDPLGKPPTQPQRVLRIGIDVQANEAITTGANDRAHLVFLDGTSLTVGPNAYIVIDKFVFDPATKTGELAVDAGKGVFRLVGGKISKSRPITITTPSGTIGIRGGITVFSVGQTSTSSTFVFGHSMTVTGQGQTQTATRPGSQIVTNFGSPPGQPTLIAQGALANQLAQLEGRSSSGQSGNSGTSGGGSGGQQGAANAERGAQTFSRQNNGAPPSPGQPLLSPGAGAFNQRLNNAVDTALNTANTGVQQVQADDRRNQQTSQSTATTTTRVIVTAGRYVGTTPYSAFDYSQNGLVVTPVASNNQLLKSTGTVTNDSQVTLSTADGHSITLPWQQTGTSFNIASFTDPTFGALSGKGYVSTDGNFFAYVFTNASNQKLGFFGGKPTTTYWQFPTSGYAAYDMNNLGGTNRLPFANGTVGDDADLQSVKDVSKLLTTFAPQTFSASQRPGDQRATAMQATIAISGTGANQKSYMGVMVGYFFNDLNTVSVGFGGNYVGTYRLDSTSGPSRLISAVSTPAASSSANAIYGQNASAIVMTPDKLSTSYTTNVDGFINTISTTRTSQAAADIPFQTLSASDYYAVNTATQTTTPSTLGQSRTSQTLSGFVAGLVDQRTLTNASPTTTAFGVSDSTPNLQLTTDASTNRASATITHSSWGSPGNGVSATFNLGSTTGTSNGTSAFIDDSNYAVMDNGSTSVQQGTTPGAVTSSTVLVSGTTNPTALNPLYTAAGVTACTCSFLTWGWWSGDVTYNSGYNAGGTDRVHLSTYVAGTLTSAVQLPMTGTATYTGDMIGNVRNGSNSYIAVGGYSNSWNFATQTGAVNISNFDGTNYQGSTALRSGTAQFTGSITAVGTSGRTGTLNGAFVNNGAVPAAGQIGNFSVTGSNYTAAGTFKAQK